MSWVEAGETFSTTVDESNMVEFPDSSSSPVESDGATKMESKRII